MNERIKELRKTLGLTLEKFGEQVGVTKMTISRIEKGVNNVTDQMFKSICREFNVNEEWLRTGEGEMFRPVEESISVIVERIMTGENQMHINLLKWVLSLDDEDIALVEKMMTNLFQISKNDKNAG